MDDLSDLHVAYGPPKSQNYNLNANEGFVISLLPSYFHALLPVSLQMKSQSIAYLLDESEHIYWILDLGDEMHSIWGLWRSGLQECKGNDFFKGRVGRTKVFGRA
jgi:hypothetical protein